MVAFFRKIVEYFDSRQIPYMLSGSVAMGLYVVSRSTRDIDFVVNLRREDVNDLVEYFSEGYYCSKEAVIDAIERRSMFNIMDHNSIYKTDFVIRKNTEYHINEFERRQLVTYYGLSVYVVSKEDLVLSKLIWIQQLQSAVQMQDIKDLLWLEDIDLNYINHWIKKLNLKTFDLFN